MTWEAPPIVVRRLSRPPYGFDEQGQLVSDVSSQALRAIYEALKLTIGSDPNDWKEVEKCWFNLLNESLGEPGIFQPSWIKGTMHRYSSEFFFVADSYARQLCHHDERYLNELARLLLPTSLFKMGQAFFLHLIYQRPANIFQNLMPLDIRHYNSRRTQIQLMWHSTAALAVLHMDYRAEFLKNMRELLRLMLTNLPMYSNLPTAQISETIPDGDTTQWDIHWQRPFVLPRYILAGAGLTTILLVIAISTGLTLLGVVALLPLLLGIGWDVYQQQQQEINLQEQNLLSQLEYSYLQDLELNTAYANLRSVSTAHEEQGHNLTAVRQAILNLNQDLNPESILNELINIIINRIGLDRVLIFWHDDANKALVFRQFSHPIPDRERLQNFRLDMNLADSINQNDPLLGQWLNGKSMMVNEPNFYLNSRLNWVLAVLEFNQFYSVPLRLGDKIMGIILADNGLSRHPISRESRTLMDSLATTVAVTLDNARLYQLQDFKLREAVAEMKLMGQVDAELVDTLKLSHVLELLMDWALRFTGARLALITLLTDDRQHARISAIYGCAEEELPGQRLNYPLTFRQAGIIGRAIIANKTQAVMDVSSDTDYVTIMSDIRAHISAPIRRYKRVVGVMTLETHKETGFTREHIEFVERLATRAGVALENALLFTESQNERNKLSAILNKTAEGVIVIDAEHKLVLLNPAAARLFRLTEPPQFYLGKYFSTVLSHPEFVAYYHEVTQSQPERDRQLQIGEKTYDTNAVWVENVGLSIILHDVTPFKELDNLKSQLVASVSHDLKTPLSVMRGFVEMIEITQKLDSKGQEYVGKITNAADNMVELITNILDLAKIETGLTLVKVPLNLHDMVVLSEDQLMLKAKEKGLRFVNHFPENMLTAAGDRLRVEQIINNLIGNAIKYTLKASDITIFVEYEDQFAKVSVTDQGVGISPEDMERLFERFVRIRNEKTQNIDGTGLGLAIVKSLVEAHGGRVGVESQEGVGSTFWFTLPLK